jgi:hypothetical protein
MRLTATVVRLAAILAALSFAFACGGLVQPSAEEDGPSSSTDAGDAALPSSDGSISLPTPDARSSQDSPIVVVPDATAPWLDASGPPAWCASGWKVQMALEALAEQDAGSPGVWVFGGNGIDPFPALIEFFRNLDVSSCTAGLEDAGLCIPCQTVSTCNYDVTNPAQVMQNQLNGVFTGPDGREWVYARLPPLNKIVLARQDLSPTDFDLIVYYNEDTICASGSGETPGAFTCGCVPVCDCWADAAAAEGGSD